MAKQEQQGSNSDCPSIHSDGRCEEDGYDDDDVATTTRYKGLGRSFTDLLNLGESVNDLTVEYLTTTIIKEAFDDAQGCVKFIDVAQELHSIGRLVLLFHHMLYYPNGSIRAMTTELITTMVKNNPRSQQLVMEINGLQPLLYNFISDPDPTSRTKALGAISALIRNNKPGITAFRLSNGYAALKEALDSKSVMLLSGNGY